MENTELMRKTLPNIVIISIESGARRWLIKRYKWKNSIHTKWRKTINPVTIRKNVWESISNLSIKTSKWGRNVYLNLKLILYKTSHNYRMDGGVIKVNTKFRNKKRKLKKSVTTFNEEETW